MTGWRMQNWPLAMLFLGYGRVRCYAAQSQFDGGLDTFLAKRLEWAILGA
jgi:hypothetical protein